MTRFAIALLLTAVCPVVWSGECPVSWSSGTTVEVRVMECLDGVIVQRRLVDQRVEPQDGDWQTTYASPKLTTEQPSESPSSGP